MERMYKLGSHISKLSQVTDQATWVLLTCAPIFDTSYVLQSELKRTMDALHDKVPNLLLQQGTHAIACEERSTLTYDNNQSTN